jgi:hypothetical protein
MMEAIRSSETSVLTRITRRNIPEDGILHSHRREKLNNVLLYCHVIGRNYKRGFLLTEFISLFYIYRGIHFTIHWCTLHTTVQTHAFTKPLLERGFYASMPPHLRYSNCNNPNALYMFNITPIHSNFISWLHKLYRLHWNQSQNYITTNDQSVSVYWFRTLSEASVKIFLFFSWPEYFLILKWGALSDERTGL